jgi:hypothetical protein
LLFRLSSNKIDLWPLNGPNRPIAPPMRQSGRMQIQYGLGLGLTGCHYVAFHEARKLCVMLWIQEHTHAIHTSIQQSERRFFCFCFTIIKFINSIFTFRLELIWFFDPTTIWCAQRICGDGIFWDIFWIDFRCIAMVIGAKSLDKFQR